ncbi:hypothetical protein LINPERPRIM_LOCUS20346 [Linum perenne]
MNRWMAPPMWGRSMKDVQEGNPTTHDMVSSVLAGGGGRCSVEFAGVAGWSFEVKIRKLLWSDLYFEFCIFS